MTSNRNDVEKFGLTQEQSDQMFNRTGETLLAEAAELRRIAERPGLVDKILNRLMGRSIEDRDVLATIEVRLAVLESALRRREG